MNGLRPSEGRVPPNDLDAEAAIISSIFMSRDNLDKTISVLEPENFYSDANRRIYEAQVELHAAGRPVDIVTVKGWLSDHNLLDRVGGVQYLVHIIDAVPSIANVDDYAKTVREKWRLRKLISTCQRVSVEGYEQIDNTQEFIDAAEHDIYSIARTPESSSMQLVKPIVIGAMTDLSNAYSRGSKITGVSTGLIKLDRILGGLHEGDLVIVAARPGIGKTSLILNMAVDIASKVDHEGKGSSVAVFSLEMPREQLATRLVCSDAGVDLSKLRTGDLNKRDWDKLTVSAAKIAVLPIWIDDFSSLSVLEMRGKIRRIQSQAAAGECPPLRLVALDYIQLMRGNPGASSREQQVSEISRNLKLLAKDLHVPVIALSQLNRSCETRNVKDKRPQLSDLRESGSLEQDADTVVFIFREDYYDQENPEVAGLAELIVAKQRNGPTGTIKVRFTKASTRFDNLAEDSYDDLPEANSNPEHWSDGL